MVLPRTDPGLALKTDFLTKRRVMVTAGKTSIDQSDSALMLGYTSGDAEAFAVLYRRHKESVYRFLFYGTFGDSQLAAELFQDVWMTIVRGRSRFTCEMDFADWLHHITWARLSDHLRLRPGSGATGAASDSATRGQEAKIQNSNVVPLQSQSVDPKSALLEEIRRLPDEHREIVLLRYCLNMGQSDIARFVDHARASVGSIQRSAAVSLRRALPEAC